VFVVDDDHSVRKALGRLLRAAGYEFELFRRGGGLPRLRAPRPAGLPPAGHPHAGNDGLELQRAIEGTPMELPIVFITGTPTRRSCSRSPGAR
jgi:FixJ family two-component response regulator